MKARVSHAVAAILDAALRGELTETQAQQLYAYGPEAVTLVLLTITRHMAEQDAGIATREAADAGPSPSTPSGMVPVYAKPNATRRPRRPGARKGHPGARRVRPTRIDRQEVHRLPRCPQCNGRLQRCRRVRSRLVEDIPQDIQPVVTEHLIHRDFCPRCKKHVEPVVPDALPRATLGHHVVALTSWFHYGLGITIDQIVEILSCHLQRRIKGTLLIVAAGARWEFRTSRNYETHPKVRRLGRLGKAARAPGIPRDGGGGVLSPRTSTRSPGSSRSGAPTRAAFFLYAPPGGTRIPPRRVRLRFAPPAEASHGSGMGRVPLTGPTAE